MSSTRYAASRQKSCRQCSQAKAKCDRDAKGCSRCARRNLECAYPQGPTSAKPRGKRHVQHDPNPNPYISPPTSHDLNLPETVLLTTHHMRHSASDDNDHDCEHDHVLQGRLGIDTDGSGLGAGLSMSPRETYPVLSHLLPKLTETSDDKDIITFEESELVCPINAYDISNRWLNQYVPLPDQAVKNYPTTITSFIYRILNSYIGVVIHGRGVPPFVHSLQVDKLAVRPPLSTCLSLARICEQQLPGATAISMEVLRREMDKLYEQHKLCDGVTLLATFQAYLIYAMIVFFRLNRGSNPFLRQAMINLQELACATSERGLLCSHEQQGIRPEWGSWIIAESKRRTLYTMYLFDSVLSTQDNLPTFLGTELRGLPASTSRTLWQASSRAEWQKSYNIHLSVWTDGFFRIDELWPATADSDPDPAQRASRVDRWLENLDEFGTMLYAVTSCTHGT